MISWPRTYGPVEVMHFHVGDWVRWHERDSGEAVISRVTKIQHRGSEVWLHTDVRPIRATCVEDVRHDYDG